MLLNEKACLYYPFCRHIRHSNNKASFVGCFYPRFFTRVQRGSKFCFVVLLLGVTVIAQNIALLSNFTMHSAALLGSLARQPCTTGFPSSLARQPCPAALPGSLARQPCPAALPGSLARQFDQFRPNLMCALAPQSPLCTTLAGHQTACARCCPDRFKLVLVQFHHAFIFCMRTLLSRRQVQTCSVVLM
jgi:hypothetical protein